MTTDTQTGLRLSVSMAGSDNNIHIVRVDGLIDTVTAPELDSVLASLVQQNRLRIILDMAGAQYVSSAGWGTFVSRLREIRDGGGDLKLARMTDDVREIYDLLEFDGILSYYDRLESAQAAFNGGNGERHSAPPPSRPPSSNAAAPTVPVTFAPSPESPVNLGGAATGVDAAILQLVLEDPFYRLGEFKNRLSELGHRSVGRWTIWQTLRRHGLWRMRERFHRYRDAHGMPRPYSR